ncbi:uncharacterized protein EKO05_0011480 [Ascochyta rabiei]|uniref:Uncharacterized protein n=1 Tax=Didymella rabiei TaxID=5454 RepID=A0A163AP85_DIDRA|nr:uncharacterized protein EKO05_0011480 [Ascochyta rabiei]KZM21303.1 hypothetical protein ST47_g7554 [Ascochyta rabiei]UPX21290.1 hypothetical protein EKO05_0011480 [Ascochyta rabiei]
MMMLFDYIKKKRQAGQINGLLVSNSLGHLRAPFKDTIEEPYELETNLPNKTSSTNSMNAVAQGIIFDPVKIHE